MADKYRTDDITFCANKCDKKTCYRHPSNIIDKTIPHSFAYLKDTAYCDEEVKRQIEMVLKKRTKEIAEDICRGNTICTCVDRDGHCASIQVIARRLAELGYRKEDNHGA